MRRVELPNSPGTFVFVTGDEAQADAHEKMIHDRYAIVVREAGARGWDPDNLTFKQLFVITDLDEWKNAGPVGDRT